MFSLSTRTLRSFSAELLHRRSVPGLCCSKGSVLSQVRDFVFIVIELHVVSAGEFYQLVKDALDDRLALQQIPPTLMLFEDLFKDSFHAIVQMT